ncbi:MAG: phosphatidylserine decarboxylase [Bryobacterales bacterium]|nr:phosphatidylserine decarboxylase [Bryobacterales bacterium]
MVATGIYYALILALAGYGLGWAIHPWAGAPFYVLALFCLWFFRDPERRIPAGPVAVSPADGKVVSIRQQPDQTRVSIFLNVFDVHVNRTPIAGKIVDVTYRKGKFLVASHEEASLENEMNTITVEGAAGHVRFSQIAGLIARRIVCYKKPGDYVTAGERIGLIKFGSRVDVWFGPEWRIEVAEGQRVAGGSSILARRK